MRNWTKRAIGSGIVVLALILVLVRLTVPPTDEQYDRIMASGVLRVGLDASYPPFESVDERGEVVGLDADLMRSIADTMGVRVEFVSTGFDGLYGGLVARKFDVIASALPFDRVRTKDVAYSHIYFRAGEALVAQVGAPTIRSLADLRGAPSVGVEFGSSAEVFARKEAKRVELHIVTFATAEDALNGLSMGQVSAVVTDAVSAMQYAKRHLDVRVILPPLTEEPNYVVAMPLNSPRLLALVNETIDRLLANGALDAAIAKWF